MDLKSGISWVILQKHLFLKLINYTDFVDKCFFGSLNGYLIVFCLVFIVLVEQGGMK